MSEIAVLAMLATELTLLLRIGRRSRLLFPTFFLAYLLYCQVVYLLVTHGIIRNDFLAIYSVGGTEKNELWTVLSYFALFIFVWVVGRNVTFTAQLRSVFTFNLVKQISFVTIAALTLYALLLSIELNWTVVWSNSVYLAMTDPRSVLLDQTGLGATYLSLLLPSAVLASCLAGAGFGLRAYGPATTLTVYSFIVSLFFLGSHQRGAAVISVVFLATLLVVHTRPNKFVCASLIIYSAFAYVAALEGRGLGFHGLASIPDTLNLITNVDFSHFIDNLLTNSAEGIFVFAETLSYPASYPISYEVLSFLPTPSAIDGFSSVRDLYQVRLHTYVPFSGYGEAIKFGPAFILLLAVYIYGIARLNRAAALVSPVGFLIVNSLTFSGLLVLNSYPIRTGLRAIWVAAGVAFVAVLISKSRSIRMSGTTEPRSASNLNIPRSHF